MTGRAGSWDHAHGGAANTGYADLVTRPATLPDRAIGAIGTYAPGAGPVIGRDGKVYLGDQQGNRRAFYPNGAASWTRKLGAWCTINASPVVDADGTIDVVGARVLRDHRDGQRRQL